MNALSILLVVVAVVVVVGAAAVIVGKISLDDAGPRGAKSADEALAEPELAPDTRGFSLAFRGYSTTEVDAYLASRDGSGSGQPEADSGASVRRDPHKS